MYTNGLGDKLKEAREDLEMTQQQAAEKINISKTTLCNYEKGKRKPNPEIIAKLANLYEVKTDWLLGIGTKKGRA